MRSIDRKPSSMGIAGVEPRQLAPTVGTTDLDLWARRLLHHLQEHTDRIWLPHLLRPREARHHRPNCIGWLVSFNLVNDGGFVVAPSRRRRNACVRVGVLTSPCDLHRSATRSPSLIDKYHISLEQLADYQLALQEW
jgi:hypothetical protein